MSRPRVSRTVDGMRARSSTDLNAAIAGPRGAVVHPGRVVRDQVHLEDLRVEQRGQLLRALGRVVDAGEQHVLDEHLAAAEREVAVALCEHVRQRDSGRSPASAPSAAAGRRHGSRARAGSAARPRRRSACRPGIQPTVEIVVRRCVIPMSGSRRAAASTSSKLRNGSPIPMKTRWFTGSMPAEVQHLVEDLRRAQVAAEAHRARSRRTCT